MALAPHDAAATVVVAVAAASIFYGPWQWVCTDWIRQVCFEARDKLFDLAADGQLDFSSPEYRKLRSIIESEIRFAHEMTLPYLFVIGSYLRYARPELVERAKRSEQAIRARFVDQIAKAEVDRIMATMNRDVLRLVLLKSPLLLVVPLLVVGPLYACLTVVKGYMRVAARFANTIIRLGASIGHFGDGDFDGMSALPPA